MYRDGRGVPQNEAEAVRWYRLAAEQEDDMGQFNLGSSYAEGRGVRQDDVQAHMWFNLATSRGSSEVTNRAVNVRDQLTNRMTPADLSEAQRLAREWDAAHPR